MKKTLIATAIAASIAAPAIASAAGPTLFGQAHYHLGYVKGYDDTGNSESGIDLASNTSRIGVKGGFDLGGGLEAIYYMEWGVNLTGDNEFSDLSERNRYGGFKSDTWGTIVFGRHDTPMKVVGRKVDLFWSTQLGQNRTITQIGDGGPGFDLRADNVIGYISPNFGPVHVFAAYVTDHNLASTPGYPLTDDNNFDAYSIAGIYDQKTLFSGDDNLYVAVAYEQHNIDQASVAGATEDNENALRVTAKYSFGGFSIPIFYQMGDNLGFQNNSDRDLYGGGLSYKFGANTLKGAIYVAGDNGTDDGAMLYSLGIDHDLSKNVQVYFQGVALDNDDNANINLAPAGTGTNIGGAPGETSYGVVFGSRIKF
jgi:predicted porin